MTRPAIVFSILHETARREASVSVDTLFYSTVEKGKHIQSVFVRLQRGENTRNFNKWRYNERGQLRGSGLFVNKTGFSANHEFLIADDGSNYTFLPGDYIFQFIDPYRIIYRKLE